ncbi:MAG: HpcH/HpaI aldolase/citrate lyase family protein [Anaerolineales bacterium]
MTQSFRSRLRRGDLLIGPMLTLGAPEVAEIMAAAGYDWLFVDAEHGAFDPPRAQATLQAAGPGCPGVVRLPSADETWIKKYLDIGAAGVIAPQVNSAVEAERVVRLCKYAPEGTRGVGLARAHEYGLGFQEYIDRANDDIAVIVQAEHRAAVADIEAIVRVPGVDAVLVGPYDLSASMGKPGAVDDPEVRAAIDRVRVACLAANVPVGYFGTDAAAVAPYIEQGYTLIIAGVDSLLMGVGARELVQALTQPARSAAN